MIDSWLDDEKLQKLYNSTSEDKKNSLFKKGLNQAKKLNLDIPKVDTNFDIKAAFNPNIAVNTNIPDFKESIKFGESMQGQSVGANIGASIGKALLQKALSKEPEREQPGTNPHLGAGGEVALRQSMPEEEHWLGPLYS